MSFIYTLRVSRALALGVFELGRLALARMISEPGRVPRLQHEFLLSDVSSLPRGATLTPVIDGWKGSSGGVVV